MKNNLRKYLSMLLALTLAFGAFSASFGVWAADPKTDPDVKTSAATATDASSSATATDATATDATATDASAAAVTENGFTFIVSNGQAVIIAANETVKGAVVIPETLGGKPVGIIGMGAFKGNGAITSVKLPDSVTTVDEQAFADCAALERIECGKALQALPESACAGCDRLNKNILFAQDSAFFA